MNNVVLRLDNISLSFDGNIIFSHMDYEFKPGIYAFSGLSGVGKSTLMRMIAGLERRYTGDIILENREESVNSKRRIIIDKPRPEVHMVHQHYKSFPWLSCLNNVLMVYKGHKVKVTEADKQEALNILERVGIKEHANKWPTQISGGQDQRLSLASAFMNKWSSIILYDEPTSALDDLNDMIVVDLIKEHQAKYNTIEIVITHEHHVIDGLNPTIIEFTPEFRIRRSKNPVDAFIENCPPIKPLRDISKDPFYSSKTKVDEKDTENDEEPLIIKVKAEMEEEAKAKATTPTTCKGGDNNEEKPVV